MKTLQVSDAALHQIIFALEARKRELNNRFPEPVSEDIAAICATLDLAYGLDPQPFKENRNMSSRIRPIDVIFACAFGAALGLLLAAFI